MIKEKGVREKRRRKLVFFGGIFLMFFLFGWYVFFDKQSKGSESKMIEDNIFKIENIIGNKKEETCQGSIKKIYDQYGNYTKDDNCVYFRGVKIKGADAETFERLESSGYEYFKDKNSVYGSGERLDIDVNSFIKLGGYNVYIKDKNNVYHNGDKMEGADSDSFRLVSVRSDVYTKDKNNVYFLGKIIKGADSASFQELNGYYQRDKNNVYCRGEIVEGADINTFEVYYTTITDLEGNKEKEVGFMEGRAKDKNNFYYNGRIVSQW